MGNIGSGTRLGAHCYDLYAAGRNELPRVAATYSDLTFGVHGTDGAMRRLFDLPAPGVTAVHENLLSLRDELHEVFRETCLRMEEIGDALVDIAVSYATTDERAVDEFARLLDKVEGEGDTTPEGRDWEDQRPTVRPPPEVGAPPTTAHYGEQQPI